MGAVEAVAQTVLEREVLNAELISIIRRSR